MVKVERTRKPPAQGAFAVLCWVLVVVFGLAGVLSLLVLAALGVATLMDVYVGASGSLVSALLSVVTVSILAVVWGGRRLAGKVAKDKTWDYDFST